jgi:hypothetical protein
MPRLAECAISLAEFATDMPWKNSLMKTGASICYPIVTWPSLGDRANLCKFLQSEVRIRWMVSRCRGIYGHSAISLATAVNTNEFRAKRP